MAGFTIPNTPDAFNANQAEPDSIDFQVLGNRTSGIIGSSFAVTPGSGTTVSVSAGELVLNGVYYKTASPQTVTLTTFSGDSFFDLIVARVIDGVITCTKLAGNAGANPRYSSAVNNDTDIVLAAVWRDGSTIDSQRITDKRTFVRSNNNRLGNNTPVNGNNGDIWVDTSTDWSSVATTAITASAHATSPVSVNVGGTWYKLASYRADLTPKSTWSSGDTASVVSRDSNGDFIARIITASLNGNASTATTATSATTASSATQLSNGNNSVTFADGYGVYLRPANNITFTAGIIANETVSLWPYADNTYNNGLLYARAWASVNAYQFNNASDARLKKDIKESPLGLDFVKSLNPVAYRWIDGGGTVQEDGSIVRHEGVRVHYGFLAQEVHEAVETANVEDFGGWSLSDKNDPDSKQFLSYNEFISPIVKAIQELSDKVDSLVTRIEALEAE